MFPGSGKRTKHTQKHEHNYRHLTRAAAAESNFSVGTHVLTVGSIKWSYFMVLCLILEMAIVERVVSVEF
jgi:hypothetical protein